jgi:hypothetical protein
MALPQLPLASTLVPRQFILKTAVPQFVNGKAIVPTPVSIAGLGSVVSANKVAAQADSTATDVAGLKTDFNALLAKLRTAGILL